MTGQALADRIEDVADEIRGLLSRSRRIACIAHKDADADSLGSALGFAHALRAAGHDVVVTVPPPLPMMLRHLPGYDEVSLTPPEADCVFAFDGAGLGRFGDSRSWIEAAPAVVNVDHHPGNERFGSVNLVIPSASATGQVVYNLLRQLALPVPEETATNLYAALFTDTGGFRHANTNSVVLRLGAELVDLGADPGWVALKSYKSRSEGQVRLEGMALSSLESEMEGSLLWVAISRDMMARCGADIQETEGIIDHLESIATMRLAIVFKEVASGRTRLSVRSRGGLDARDVCTPFGGGGHLRQAGAEIDQPLAEVARQVVDRARDLIRETR